jgi:taspase, threonine aspartase, 1
MLVSQGAYTFAASNNVPTCDAAALVAPHCISEWKIWKKILADPPPSLSKKDLAAEIPIQDTVGAISWDSNGKLAAGVSRFAIILPSYVLIQSTVVGCSSSTQVGSAR